MWKRKNPLLEHLHVWKTDKEILSTVSLMGKLGLIMTLSVVVFILFGFWMDSVFNINGVGIAIGTICGLIIGALICMRFSKERIEKKYD
jgi:F0F1-type ATP synthase assembly protein I